jgi:hypothetical protein
MHVMNPHMKKREMMAAKEMALTAVDLGVDSTFIL